VEEVLFLQSHLIVFYCPVHKIRKWAFASNLKTKKEQKLSAVYTGDKKCKLACDSVNKNKLSLNGKP
jgi:hypothetical protein